MTGLVIAFFSGVGQQNLLGDFFNSIKSWIGATSFLANICSIYMEFALVL